MGLRVGGCQLVLLESFLDSPGAGAADALVDRECLLQKVQAFVVVAVLETGPAESFESACFLQGRAEVAGDGQRLGVTLAGLAGVRGPGR